MVIWLASYPRSGNTLARIALNHLFGIRTGSIYEDAVLVSSGASATVGHAGGPVPLDEWRSDRQQHLVKTHRQPTDGLPAIYIVRDGRDSLVSHANYIARYASDLPAELALNGPDRPGQILRWLVEEGHPAYGSWSDHVVAWHLREPAPFVVRYEDLAQRPGEVLEPALRDLGLPVERTAGRMPSFGELHQRWPGFFRQGVAGGWKAVMSHELEGLFWRRHRTAMELLGYR